MVKDFQVGDKVEDVFGVHDISLARYSSPKRAGEQYLRIILGDHTGTIEGRMWDTPSALDVYRTIKAEDLVKVHGTVQEFNGMQINVSQCRKADSAKLDPADFRPMSEKPLEQLWSEIEAKLSIIEKPYWQELLKKTEDEGFRRVAQYTPAGRQVHHNYGGGLLEHTLEVVSYCQHAFEIQGKGMDKELLTMGAFFHDLGKIQEYDPNSFTFQMTDKAKLTGGHIVLGKDLARRWMEDTADFPEDKALALEHMILSHHGMGDWGSPVEPKTLEAITLHHADLLSARINQAQRVIGEKQTGKGRWTDYDRLLGRSLLVPFKEEEDQLF